MEGEKEVRLHGMWVSPYSKAVEVALKTKGIAYEYVEEDLRNKSQALAKYNLVHKKVLVLVNNGKPLAETLIILDYIDEAWPNNVPRLQPQDPFDRARVRFWATFLSQVQEGVLKLFRCKGDAQQKALDDLHQKMGILEQEMTDLLPEDPSAINSNNLGLLDILMNSVLGLYNRAAEEAIGMKILDPQKHPLIFSWVIALIDLPVHKETAPPHDKLVAFIKMYLKIHTSA